ncbi:amidohydrolase [Sciscionella sediminilitoris]|uniref:amidohydrolase n=1 Tax=Sciscionella sediminilitoris TaxID=1445613 RepID=UPI0004DF154B|nr:amidohydrolase [Sciscionella sp. SE31]
MPDHSPMNRAGFLRLAGATGAAGVLAGCGGGTEPEGERVLLTNVRGYTIADGKLRRFGSVLIGADGKVAALDPGNTGGARQVDGRGRVCLPGLHDAHCHLSSLAEQQDTVELSDTGSLDEALGRLRDWSGKHPGNDWITGGRWNDVRWHLGRLPGAADLDRAVADRPVALERVDGHAMLVNSAALGKLGITADTPAPQGGQIVRGPDGKPTGLFVDAAADLVTAKLPQPSETVRRQRFRELQRTLNSVGLTSVSDADMTAADLAALRSEIGSLSYRANVFLSWDAFTELAASARTDSAHHDRLRVRTVKLYADGALGSHGAAMLAPYADDPTASGLPQLTQAELDERVRKVVGAGFQCAVHAIGDRGNRMVLDAYERAFGGREQPLRHRVEHAQILDPADIPRFPKLGLIASMQPVHATDDMNMAETRIGRERMAGAYAWRRLLDEGVVVPAGSDFAVSSHNPFDGWHAAVTRTDHEGKPHGGWYPEQAMTPVEALRAYTHDAAYAAHQEHVLGSLEPGKWADLLLIDQDPFELPSGKAVWQTKVLETWLAGRRVGQYGQL